MALLWFLVISLLNLTVAEYSVFLPILLASFFRAVFLDGS